MKERISKITILFEADQVLDQMVLKVNEGFTGGRVTKSDLSSWIIRFFNDHALESNLEKIRKDHFDQVAYLETVVKEMKQARKNGLESPDLTSLLAPVTSTLRVKSKKDGQVHETAKNEQK